ncbi:hypothetical protein OESDEN_06865 [Oesophagostomum dentatum]|uniref:SXP/RAL-2 family protein Ani s 5-like cation-binding domain-containing protein n=1 Tax=Oesophagostomum dentatum TaxID=61180 RepID=A0A0B1TBN4_OESDE|nr:hypothetical protein OESDEN_06865 [Oesophagostomum dentatum]
MIKAMLALGLLSMSYVVICEAGLPGVRPFFPWAIEKLSDEEKEEFVRIWEDPNNTRAQKYEKSLAWAKKNDVMEEYNKHKEEIDRFQIVVEGAKKVSDVINRLPAFYNKYMEILTDMNQTERAINDKLEILRRENPTESDVAKYVEELLWYNEWTRRMAE